MKILASLYVTNTARTTMQSIFGNLTSAADGRSDPILNPLRWNNSPRSYIVMISWLNYFTYLSRVSLARPRDRMTSRTSITNTTQVVMQQP